MLQLAETFRTLSCLEAVRGPEQLIMLSSEAVDAPVELFSCLTVQQLLEARRCVGGCCDLSSALLFFFFFFF